MAVVQNTYTGNGSTVLYSLSFPYLDQTDVKVSVNGTIVTNYIFATASSIQFLTAPANGAAIRIYRETDIDEASNTIFAGSAIKASDLNENFTQTLYAVQESNFEADSATTTANTALTTANTALGTANTALSNSSTAVSTANSAVSTANAANASAAAAVSTANTASSNASAAVTTANAASSAASTAVSTANAATSTANTALSNSTTAISTANTASTNASNAVTTANTASSNATTAVATANAATTTANNALSTANTALSNSNTAISTANSAIAAVASAVIYTPVANLTALAALTPTNGDYFELTDSTGAESSALITGVTVGLVGAPGLTFRLRYDAPPGIFTFLGYFANDSETRYLKLAGGTLTGQLRGDDSTSASTPGFAFDGDPNTGVGRPGADELALITGGTARVTIDSAGAVAVPGSLSQGGNAVVVTTDSRLSDQRVPTDGSVTNTKVAAAAAIDGTKISPNFGSQNVVTTGTSSAAALIPTGSSVPTNGTYLPAANAVAIATNSTERLRIDSSGRLGLGTSSPSATVHAVSSSDVLLYLNRSTSDGEIARFMVGGNTAFSFSTTAGGIRTIDASNADLRLRTNSVDRLTVTSGGAVGIGTTTPTVQFEVSGTDARIQSTNTLGSTKSVLLAGNGTAYFGTTTNHPQAFVTNDVERGRFDTSGRFLVGTSSSANENATFQVQGSGSYAAQFFYSAANAGGSYLALSKSRGSAGSPSGISSGDVQGAIVFKGYAGTGWSDGAYIEAITDGTPGTGDIPTRLVFSTTADGASSPTARVRLQANGQLNAFDDSGNGIVARSSFAAGTGASCFIGVRSATDATNGTPVYQVFTNGTYQTISDSRQKKNIETTRDGYLADLCQLRVVKYNWNEQEDGQPKELGLIAQEVEAVFPGLVSEMTPDLDDQSFKGVKVSVLPFMLLKALQEANAKIETLEAKVAALEAA